MMKNDHVLQALEGIQNFLQTMNNKCIPHFSFGYYKMAMNEF